MSEALPPMATTFPTVAPHIGATIDPTKTANKHTNFLRLTFADISFPLPYEIFLTPNA
jgi:hypothetical protein